MSQPDLSKEYADSVRLDDEEGVAQVLTQSVLGLWEVVNNLTRLRPVQWRRFRVTIFGSARAEPGTMAYEHVTRLARELSAMGCEIVTGGGPGLMQAANEGAAGAAPDDRDGQVILGGKDVPGHVGEAHALARGHRLGDGDQAAHRGDAVVEGGAVLRGAAQDDVGEALDLPFEGEAVLPQEAAVRAVLEALHPGPLEPR